MYGFYRKFFLAILCFFLKFFFFFFQKMSFGYSVSACFLDGILSIVFQQADSYDRVDQMSLLRQEQLLKAQSLQSADALDGSSRYRTFVSTFFCCI